ncbi:GNAT family N-acetyltransferase [Streptomyces sp. NPDC020681]|uniref:GNAT family N-acetyltransferase n=1 Tax=Streptomyces sp. NPDC020681 TaxID=3365083 RepID=UPI0037B3351C
MTTTLRPTGPIQHETDGARARSYEVCVNSRPVGAIELATVPRFGSRAGAIRSLRIDEADRRRGRGTVAALAAEEVLRGWGCDQVQVSVPREATAATALAAVLGYTERGRSMLKSLGEPPELPADVEARPMTELEFRPWLAAGVEAYAQDWIERGVAADQARTLSKAGHAKILPDGLASPDTEISVLVHRGEVVGTLFVGRNEVRPGEQAAYVYDVEVVEGQRGHGHGRSLMLLAERGALASGIRLLGLHVFAGNTPALRLYQSLGYETTTVHSYKPLL